MSKKILIVGNGANVYALAKKLSLNNEIYVAPGNKLMKDFATVVDIREEAVAELLDFAMETGIDLTIPVSEKTVLSELASIFNSHDQQVFAPSFQASKKIFDKAIMKKILYKLRIPTPKFGIFEKQNMALDYIKNTKVPFVIKSNEKSSAVVLTSLTSAKSIIDSFFSVQNQKVIIEDYLWGTPFSFYALTDGYKALPIVSSIMYKHSLEGEGGQLTAGMGACIPNYKLSIDNEYFLMDNVVYPLIEYLEKDGNPYMGVLGVNGILSEDGNIQILGFNSFFQDADSDAILNIIDADLYSLFESCVIGSFSDEVDFIPQKDLSYTSVVLACKNKENIQNSIYGLDNICDETSISFYPTVTKNRYLEYEANYGSVLVITSSGRTATTATKNVYEDLDCLKFKGIYYRKDICKPQREHV